MLLRSDGKALMIGDIWPFRVPRLKIRQRTARDAAHIIEGLYFLFLLFLLSES